METVKADKEDKKMPNSKKKKRKMQGDTIRRGIRKNKKKTAMKTKEEAREEVRGGRRRGGEVGARGMVR